MFLFRVVIPSHPRPFVPTPSTCQSVFSLDRLIPLSPSPPTPWPYDSYTSGNWLTFTRIFGIRLPIRRKWECKSMWSGCLALTSVWILPPRASDAGTSWWHQTSLTFGLDSRVPLTSFSMQWILRSGCYLPPLIPASDCKTRWLRFSNTRPEHLSSFPWPFTTHCMSIRTKQERKQRLSLSSLTKKFCYTLPLPTTLSRFWRGNTLYYNTRIEFFFLWSAFNFNPR